MLRDSVVATHDFGDHTDVGSLNAANDLSGQTRKVRVDPNSKQLVRMIQGQENLLKIQFYKIQ